ncbi:MAG: hypothetical protein K0S61_149 [Anaerocolumna sp.]|nr:hypothetical protein [Anaerocolumna sp.]
MSGIGKNHKIWNKELDEKLLKEISSGKNSISLQIAMGVSQYTIGKRLKQMGFDGLRDARQVMNG